MHETSVQRFLSIVYIYLYFVQDFNKEDKFLSPVFIYAILNNLSYLFAGRSLLPTPTHTRHTLGNASQVCGACAHDMAREKVKREGS